MGTNSVKERCCSTGAAYALMATSWLLWALDPIFIRLIGDGVARPVIAGLSPLLAGLVLLRPAIRGAKAVIGNRSLWVPFACYILFSTIAADLMYVMAVRHLNPGLVSLILRSQIVLIVLEAWVFLGEKPDRFTISGMAAVIAGYSISAYLSIQNAGAGRNAGLGWICAVGAAFLWSFSTILGKKLLMQTKSVELCGLRLLSAGALITAGYIAMGNLNAYTSLTGGQWGLIFTKMLFCTCVAYAIYTVALKAVTATVAAAMEQCAPLFSLCVASFFLGEHVNLRQWLAIGVVFAGSVWILAHQYQVAAAKTKRAQEK